MLSLTTGGNMTYITGLIDDTRSPCKSIDEMLCQAFFIKNTLIMGKSNSARIEEWIQTKSRFIYSTIGVRCFKRDWYCFIYLDLVRKECNEAECK